MSMGKPFQSTINLDLRLGDKIHPIFNNYLLNFKHSGFSDYLLTRRELRFKLTHRAGLPDQTQGKQRLIWALSFTRCCKDRSYDVLQKWQREVWDIRAGGKPGASGLEQGAQDTWGSEWGSPGSACSSEKLRKRLCFMPPESCTASWHSLRSQASCSLGFPYRRESLARDILRACWS